MDQFLIKFLVKKDVCGSREQCTGPVGSAILDQCVDVQSASGSCAQCTRPTGKSVSHVKPTSGKKKKKKGGNVKTQNANMKPLNPNAYIVTLCCGKA